VSNGLAHTLSSAGPSVSVGKWAHVMPVGTPEMNDGRKFKFSPEDLQIVFNEVTKKLKKGDVPVLFEHGKGPRGGVAAGWFSRFELRADGLWGLVRWVANAANEIRADLWRHLSPGFYGLEDPEGYIRPRQLFEVSLTNKPAIHGLTRVAAEVIDVSEIEAEAAAEFEMYLAESQLPAKSDEDETAKEDMVNFKEFAVLLGLAEEATEEDIKKNLQERANALEEIKAKYAAVEAELAEIKKVQAEVEAKAKADAEPKTVTLTEAEMTAKVEAEAKAKAEAIVAEQSAVALVASLVEQGVKDGKIVAAKRESYETLARACPEAFKEMLADLRVQAPVEPVTSGTIAPVKITADTAKEKWDRIGKLAKKYACSYAEALGMYEAGQQ